jgi:spermidine synthase
MNSPNNDASELGVTQRDIETQRISIVILFCFFLSGFLGLVYEIIWIRKLGLILGTTVFAMSTVFTAFFGGLALGSLVFGKLANRVENSVRVYAYLEFAVGVFALLFPTLLHLFRGFYTIFYPYIYRSFIVLTLTRFITLSLILAIPTTMMGGTLPLLSQYFVKRLSNMSFKIGILYALNTFGATLGAFLCGFYFIRHLGVDYTNYLAGILNLLIGLIAYLSAGRLALGRAKLEETTDRKSLDNHHSSLITHHSSVVICYFFAGFTSIAYEVVWTRYLSLALENTVYTYTIILTVFLLGIALGSILFSRLFDRAKDLLRLFGYLELGIGLSAFVLGPIVYLLFMKVAYKMLMFEFLVCGALMLIPTTLMGATFPIIVKMLTANVHRIGNSTGRLYAINTFGCIVGSLSAGFLLLPSAGINLSLNMLVAINILIGFLCLFANPTRRQDGKTAKRQDGKTAKRQDGKMARRQDGKTAKRQDGKMARWQDGKTARWLRSSKFNAIAVVLILGTLIGSRFALKIQIPQEVLSIVKVPEEKIILVEEGLENTVWVTVNQQNQQKSIWANKTVLGRTKAQGQFNIAPQPIQGHIPMLLHQGTPKNILGICLGTGQTFGSMLMYDIDKMDIVDISKTIVDVALEHFADYNGNPGNDARTTVIVEDGRNFVAHTKHKYDIITLEPSPPEEAGIVNLYTREFYQLCQKRLNKDGIMSQWLPLYNTRPDETMGIIKTFISVFPDSLLWYNSADLLLLGFNDEIHLDAEKISARLQNEKVYNALDLSYLGYPEYNLNHIDNFLAGLLMGPKELREISQSVSAYTDNHPDLEFSALNKKILKGNIRLEWNSPDRPEWLKIQNTDLMTSYLASLHHYIPGISSEELQKIEKVRAQYIAHLYAQAYSSLGIARSKENKLEDAIAFYRKAVEYNPSYAPAYSNMGKDYYATGQNSEAIEAYKTAVKLEPNLPEAWHGLGTVYFAIGWLDDAITVWQRAVEVKPDFCEAYNNLGVAYAAKGRYYTAIDAYQKAIKFNPNYADAYYNLGLVYEVTNQFKNACDAYEKAIEINPNFTDARKSLEACLKRLH